MKRDSARPRKKDTYARIANPLQRLSLHVLDALDTVVYALVGLAFVGAAMLALVYSLAHLLLNFGLALPLSNDAVTDVLNFVSDLLLVLIIMEVLGTVRSYLEKGDTSVKPFLFIGIISATRGILSIGARLSIAGTGLSTEEFRNSMIELAIDAFVIIALGITIRILGAAADLPPEEPLLEGDGQNGEVRERVVVETTFGGHADHMAVEHTPST